MMPGQSRLIRIMQAALLIGIGCLQLTGDLLGMETIKAVGAITHASPAPKVFTSQRGYETYTPQFFVSAIPVDGARQTIQLTPELNSLLRGPYNRRNAYGAVLSYGPVLASDQRSIGMFEAVLLFATCSQNALVTEVGLPRAPRYEIDIVQTAAIGEEQSQTGNLPKRFAVSCVSQKVTML